VPKPPVLAELINLLKDGGAPMLTAMRIRMVTPGHLKRNAYLMFANPRSGKVF